MTDHNARQAGLPIYQELDPSGLWEDVSKERYEERVQMADVRVRVLAAHSADTRNREGVALKDYEEAFADHQRMVRELDVLLNGDGAAKQASLCDIVAQVRKEGIRSEGVSLNEKQQKDLRSHMMAVACRTWDETPSTSIKAHLRAVVKAIAAEPKIRAALLAAPTTPAPLDVTAIPGYVTPTQASETAEAHAKIGQPMDPCDCAACVKMRGHLYGDMSAAPAPTDLAPCIGQCGNAVPASGDRICHECREAAPADAASEADPKPGEIWHVILKGASSVFTAKVNEITPATVLLQKPNDYYETRYVRADVRFVECAVQRERQQGGSDATA